MWGKERPSSREYSLVSLEIEPYNAMCDPSGLLLSFTNKYGTFIYHNGQHSKHEMAKKILDTAKKIAGPIALGGVGAQAGLSKNKDLGIAGGIAGMLVGWALTEVIDHFEDDEEIVRGFYLNGNLVFPDKHIFQLD